MKVMKFGGGCLRDCESFLNAENIIISESTPTAVVVSAIYGITDVLVKGIDLALKNENNINEIIKSIQEKHYLLAEKAIEDENFRKQTLSEISSRIGMLEKIFYGISYTGEATDSVKAMILSYGERLCAHLLTGILLDKGKESIALESDKIGLFTDESYENATVLFSEIPIDFVNMIVKNMKEGIVPVITGYFGRTIEGKITTFGRNGSDYSASVIANIIKASDLEIWKDVDGFMSADPKIVKNAKWIDRLSYYEAAELSYFGAKILHPRATEPLIKNGTHIFIKNVYKPGEKGTEISPHGYEKKDIVKSVTYNNQITVLRIHGPGVGYKPGIIGKIGDQLSAKGIDIYSIITSQTCINLLIDKKDSVPGYECLRNLKNGVIESIILEEDRALIAVVGEGLFKRKGVFARVFSAVSKDNINVEMVSGGASEVAYYFIVHESDMKKVINSIHREFFN